MNDAAIVEGIGIAPVYRQGAVEIVQGGVEFTLGGSRDAAIAIGVGQTRIYLQGARAIINRSVEIAFEKTHEAAIRIGRRGQRIEDLNLIEIKRRPCAAAGNVRTRTDLDGSGEFDDGAVNFAFLVTSAAAIVRVLRRSRRLPFCDRSEDAQKERGEYDAMALHTTLLPGATRLEIRPLLRFSEFGP